MTNALVLIEACSVCGLVQRVYLGRRARRRTPLTCRDCSRPWIQWSCDECGSVTHEQVDALPKRGAHFGVCSACHTEAERLRWARSSRDESRKVQPPAASREASLGRRG